MIDFFETKAFGAVTVGVLTTMTSLYSGINAWVDMSVGLLIASTFLLMFKKTNLCRSPPDVTSDEKVQLSSEIRQLAQGIPADPRSADHMAVALLRTGSGGSRLSDHRAAM
jgi:hypothetical protein